MVLFDVVCNILLSYVNCIYICQFELFGFGYVVLCVKFVVGDEFFVVLLVDDLFDGEVLVIKQMVEKYDYYCCLVLGVQDVLCEDMCSYGIVVVMLLVDWLEVMSVIVEKLKFEEVFFMLVVVGCYVLMLCIFYYFENVKLGVGGEIQFIDGIVVLFREEQVLVYCYDGVCYDCGFKLGYLQVIVELGCKYVEVGIEFFVWLVEWV